MPADLNKYELQNLTEVITELKPGRSFVSNCGLVVRRRHNTSGYDLAVGRGGYSHRRANTPVEAAEWMLRESAKKQTPTSLGGKAQFSDYEAAIESVRKGESIPSGPSPAAKTLRRLVVKAGLHSYRSRAQVARDALGKGDVNGAVRQLEAILEHAGNNGRLKDAERAQAALAAIRDHHEIDGALLPVTKAKIEIRVRGDKHHVYRDGADMTGPLTRTEAESRRGYMARQVARLEDVEAIETEQQELPSALREEPQAA